MDFVIALNMTVSHGLSVCIFSDEKIFIPLFIFIPWHITFILPTLDNAHKILYLSLVFSNSVMVFPVTYYYSGNCKIMVFLKFR